MLIALVGTRRYVNRIGRRYGTGVRYVNRIGVNYCIGVNYALC